MPAALLAGVTGQDGIDLPSTCSISATAVLASPAVPAPTPPAAHSA